MATPTRETAIWLALKGRVQALLLDWPIAWPNEAFTPPVEMSGPNKGSALPYLKIEHIPNRTLRTFIASDAPHHYRGILQIGVMAKLNQNAAVGIELAGDIANHFRCDLRVISHGVTVRITSHPAVGPAQPQATHLLVPVSVEYEAWA